MLLKGRTAIEGWSGKGNSGRAGSAGAAGGGAGWSRRAPTKAEALARDGADQALLLAAVADRLARGVDAAGQRRFRHDAALPDRGDEIVLADHPLAILDQVDQKVEHLRLERDQLAVAPQLAPVRVEDIIPEKKLQLCRLPVADRASNAIIKRFSRTNQAAVKGFCAGAAHRRGHDSNARLGGGQQLRDNNDLSRRTLPKRRGLAYRLPRAGPPARSAGSGNRSAGSRWSTAAGRSFSNCPIASARTSGCAAARSTVPPRNMVDGIVDNNASQARPVTRLASRRRGNFLQTLKGDDNATHPGTALRLGSLRDFLRHVSLRHRLCLRPRRAEDDRQRDRRRR